MPTKEPMKNKHAISDAGQHLMLI